VKSGTVVVADRIHSTKSEDGTEIAGHVRGSGRALVLVHGGLGDGNPDMNMMLPFLVGHFSCFLMNTRGRGLSAENDDHSRERMYEDVVAFADSIGEPSILFGHSSGATWALGAMSRSQSCVRAALYEPALPVTRPVITDEAYRRFASALGEGRLAEAALLSLDAVVEPTDDERALFSAVAELTGPVLPATMRELPELNRAVDDASVDAITIPVALLHGTRSAGHFQEAIRLLEARLTSSEVVAFEGAGHLGPMTHASEVANALIPFAEATA
jgi:pimeloyl-ACP methyl ester carboxylesterase